MRIYNYIRDSLFGFHILQFCLFISLFFPSLVPTINNVWRSTLFALPIHQRGRSIDLFNFDCLFAQHVSEWALPIENASSAIAAVENLLKNKKINAHFPVEIRFVASDDSWLSPTSGRLSVYIGIISYRPYGFDSPYTEYFAAYEDIMRRENGRPHWAKDFVLAGDKDFSSLYPKWNDFKNLRKQLDPNNVFINRWLQEKLGLAE
jgi:L-gulonolactone oxidase